MFPLAERARQRESFHKFDLIAANAAMERIDAAVCVFELRGGMIGQAFIPDISEKTVTINSLILNSDVSSRERQDTIETVSLNNQVDPYRRLFLCPECGSTKWALYYENGWSCAKCLDLVYRSQLVGKDVKLWEERKTLRKRLEGGRAKGMHNKTFIKLHERLSALDCQLRGRSENFASRSHDLIVQSRWVAGAEIDLWSTQYVVRNGEFVVC